MNLIPTRIHGILDYVVGLLLLVAPWMFGFADNRPAMMVPVVMGAGAIVYSLLTNYELGAARVLPMSAHLALDICSGLLLLASPWLFGFADRIVWPPVVFGILEIGVALLTQRTPHMETTHDHHNVAHV
jgi:hypothetical protein